MLPVVLDGRVVCVRTDDGKNCMELDRAEKEVATVTVERPLGLLTVEEISQVVNVWRV